MSDFIEQLKGSLGNTDFLDPKKSFKEQFNSFMDFSSSLSGAILGVIFPGEWYFSTQTAGFKRKVQERKAHKLHEFNEINNYYNLTLTHEEIDANAYQWGYLQTRRHVRFGGEGGLKDWVNILGTVAIVAISAIITFYCAACAGILYSSITSAHVSFGLTVASAVANFVFTNLGAIHIGEMLALQGSIKALASHSYFNARTRASKEAEQIAHILMFNPYAMCAGNTIYNAQRAGGDSFSPTQAYDPNKGFLGTYKHVESDEQIMRRAQVNLGGNNSFLENTLNPPFPLKKVEEHKLLVSESITRAYARRRSEIFEGFSLLTKAEYGLAYNNPPKIDEYDTDTPSGIGARAIEIYEKQTFAYKNKLINDRFLDSLKSYSKGEMQDFHYLFLKDFKTLSKKQIQEMQTGAISGIKDAMERAKNNPKEMAKLYYNQALSMLNLFLNEAIAHEVFDNEVKNLLQWGGGREPAQGEAHSVDMPSSDAHPKDEFRGYFYGGYTNIEGDYISYRAGWIGCMRVFNYRDEFYNFPQRRFREIHHWAFNDPRPTYIDASDDVIKKPKKIKYINGVKYEAHDFLESTHPYYFMMNPEAEHWDYIGSSMQEYYTMQKKGYISGKEVQDIRKSYFKNIINEGEDFLKYKPSEVIKYYERLLGDLVYLNNTRPNFHLSDSDFLALQNKEKTQEQILQDIAVKHRVILRLYVSHTRKSVNYKNAVYSRLFGFSLRPEIMDIFREEKDKISPRPEIIRNYDFRILDKDLGYIK